MASQGRRHIFGSASHPLVRISTHAALSFGAVFCAAMFLLSLNTFAQSIDFRYPLNWKQDAELTDLHCLDAERCWIVGDRGLVMRTEDGGKKWKFINLVGDRRDPDSPRIQCRLESVFFVSPTHGWIAGGFSNAGSTTSTGLLFATVDGGKSWKQLQGISLPKINQVIFNTPLNGIAIGDGNAEKPTGIFSTRDGGRTWSVVKSGSIESWKTADHFKGITVLASADGNLGRYENDTLGPSLIEQQLGDAHQSQIHEFNLLDDRFGFAVGDNNRLLVTRNGGHSWGPVSVDLGEPVDFHTLSIQGNRVWLAGNPGSRIWTRTMEETRWKPQETPLRTPISKLCFINEQVGWAIGLCGDIIHTVDGGLSWQLQRRGTGGVALLQVANRTSDFVPELFSKFCGDENYIGAALHLEIQALTETAKGTSEDEPTIDHVRQALSRVGGCFALNRQLSQKPTDSGTILDPASMLARDIRSLRPRIIAIPAGHVKNATNLRGLVLNAVRIAADSESSAVNSLPPWQVGKVVVMDRGDVASLKISPNHYMTELGALLTDHSAVSRVLLGQAARETSNISLTTIFTSPYAAGPGNRLFAGIENTDAGIPVRKGSKRTSGNMAQMRLLAGKRKTFDRLLSSAADVSSGIWGNHLSELTMPLDPAVAGVWLSELASLCDAKGRPDIAAQTHLYLTKHYRRHSLATISYRWLFNYYSSAEQAHVAAQKAKWVREAPIKNEAFSAGNSTRPIQQQFGHINVVSWEVDDPRNENLALTNPEWTVEERKNTFRRRFQQARSVAQSFALIDATALDIGRYELARIGLNRRLDPMISVSDQLKQVARSSDPVLNEIALRELAISDARTSTVDRQNKNLSCHQAAARPWLDGQLNEKIWQDALEQKAQLVLHNKEGQPNDTILFSSDEQFLYIAIRCHLNAEQITGIPNAKRVRDANLNTADRIEIAIDIDRDFNNFFLFSIDCTGRVAESLGDNRAWNPTWYVAHDQSPVAWTAEVAIPLEEISTYGDHWAVAATRYQRNRLRSQSWDAKNVSSPIALPKAPSFHKGANQIGTAMLSFPLQSFQIIEMPWAEPDNSTEMP